MNYRMHKLAAMALAGLLLTAPSLRAEVTDESMEELRATLGDLSAKVNTIESVTKKISFSGDFRYRYEKLDELWTGGKVDRERYRIRLRLNGDGKVNDWSKVKFRIATGGASAVGTASPYGLYSDPVSTNQTLQDYGDNKIITLDKAELVLAPKIMLSPVLEFGKMGTPFSHPEGELIFDGDLTPEGIALALDQNLAGVDLKVIGAQFINGEVSGSTEDPKFEGGQVIAGTEFLGLDFKVAGAYYNWINNKNGTAAAASQNTNTGGIDVDVVDAWASLETKFIGGSKIEAYYEWEKNSMVDKDEDGYMAGASFASGKLIPLEKDWLKLNYNYRFQKKDATFSPWNFSDFAGGKTDASGSMVSGKIKLFDNTDMGLTYFSNIIGLTGVTPLYRQFERWQWDLAVKF